MKGQVKKSIFQEIYKIFLIFFLTNKNLYITLLKWNKEIVPETGYLTGSNRQEEENGKI